MNPLSYLTTAEADTMNEVLQRAGRHERVLSGDRVDSAVTIALCHLMFQVLIKLDTIERSLQGLPPDTRL